MQMAGTLGGVLSLLCFAENHLHHHWNAFQRIPHQENILEVLIVVVIVVILEANCGY